jgi:hypothetical protein
VRVRSSTLTDEGIGTLAFTTNSLTTAFLTDQWGRRKMILAGLSAIILIEIYAAVMQLEFQNTSNRVGKGFAVLGIYLFDVTYYGLLNSTTWLYGAEVGLISSTVFLLPENACIWPS